MLSSIGVELYWYHQSRPCNIKRLTDISDIAVKTSSLVINLFTATLMYQPSPQGPNQQRKAAQAQPPRYQNPQYEGFGPALFPLNNPTHPWQTPANTLGPGWESSQYWNPQRNGTLYHSTTAMPRNLAPSPFQGPIESKPMHYQNQTPDSSHWPGASNYPYVHYGSSPALAPVPYYTHTAQGHNIGGQYPPVVPPPQQSMAPRTPAFGGAHSGQNETLNLSYWRQASNCPPAQPAMAQAPYPDMRMLVHDTSGSWYLPLVPRPLVQQPNHPLNPSLVGAHNGENQRSDSSYRPQGEDNPPVHPAVARAPHHAHMRGHETSGSWSSPVDPLPLQRPNHAVNLSLVRPHDTQSGPVGEGSFAQAHDFNIETMIVGYNQVERVEEKEVLEKLLLKGLPSATLDSENRGYIPRCDEQTRLTIRDHVVSWAQDPTQPHCLFWLSGPAAVGKSAVAQTVAETMKAMGHLVAVFFFSRPNSRSDPNAVVATLALQLYTSIPEYRRIVADKITQDPTILQKHRNIQFQELITDPFLILAKSRIASNAQSILIVLDGLDECRGETAQSDFVAIIGRHAQLGSPLPFKFLICSRPEPHLKVVFSKPEIQVITVQEKLEVDDPEAQRDAYQLLQKGFAEIRSRYPDQLTDDWPTLAQTRPIADRALGHLGFVSFILRFIGDESYNDPSRQLEFCIRFLECSRGSEDSNPLHALDLLYTQIFSDIPPAVLPTTQRILALFITSEDMADQRWSLYAQATFLGLSQASTYSALHRLHSVIAVPSPTQAIDSGLGVYHASFTDYLKDSARSGKFALDTNILPSMWMITLSMEWLNCIRKIVRGGIRSQVALEALLPQLPWKQPLNVAYHNLADLTHFSFSCLWRLCPKVPEDSFKGLMNALEKFDFDLDYNRYECKERSKGFTYTRPEGSWPEWVHFPNFIRWLVTLGTLSASLIKVIPPHTCTMRTPHTTLTTWVPSAPNYVAPFSHFEEESEPGDRYTVYIELGRGNPILLKLFICSNTDCVSSPSSDWEY
ncbi:hypothetical protein NP233_g12408 [Leucocoprinus birnbaumii]|uniref:Nephrocystin 3-like N-terminal domain-containing protein n=1 Tax=Leucocoprinus birnbaumii TaxID=56174 RepID=A0AAD5VEH0_9AGAR|nr:hypothetical protein NP233_g12408 [Leucocoprinus birnbaumii]